MGSVIAAAQGIADVERKEKAAAAAATTVAYSVPDTLVLSMPERVKDMSALDDLT